MTDEQINAAIAEACGWKAVCVDGDSGFYKGFDNGAELRPDFPDYCTDLNAMNEAEKMLAPKNWNRFSEKWWNYYHHLVDGDVYKTIHATARQRAEAFLRTLGKWEEVQND
jgi:hypothetical protein